MKNLVPALLPTLGANRLEGLDAGPGACYPAYDGYSLVNIPASICHWLGAPAFGAPPLGPEILNQYPQDLRHVILLVVDGLGLNTLQNALQRAPQDPDYSVWAELAVEGMLAPLTSIVPSTTSAALTTLWTGRTPAEHGIVGYEVWLKEYSLIANMIHHSPASFNGAVGSLRQAGFDPLTFLPVPTLGPHLAQHGVQSYAFQHQSIAHSGLSGMLQPEVEVVPYKSLSDLWVTVDAMLDARSAERNYIYIYWGELDEHSHRFGPEDPRVALELASFSRQMLYFVRERKARGRQDTLLLVSADHGHLATPRRAEYELRRHPKLLDLLAMLPSGEARLPLVYLRPGCEQAFLDYLEATWPGQFIALPAQQAMQAGLFGKGEVYARLADRVGDYVLIPQGEAYWWFANRDNPLLGRHGGLSQTEMLVPLLSTLI